MTTLSITVRGDDVGRILRAAGEQTPAILARTLNTVAGLTRAAMVPALTRQTGLKRKTIERALKLTPASPGLLRAVIYSQGGDISLRHFAPRETAGGVSAAPWGQRRTYAGSFMKGGRFPNRVTAPKLHGGVFMRAGAGRLPLKRVRSGEFIPLEMVKGATAAAFTSTSTAALGPAVDNALARLLGGGR